MVHNAIGYQPPTDDRTATTLDGFDAPMIGIVKREHMTVPASNVRDGDILTKSYYQEGNGISVDYGKVMGEPWPGKYHGESMVTIVNCFGEQEIVSLKYSAEVRRQV